MNKQNKKIPHWMRTLLTLKEMFLSLSLDHKFVLGISAIALYTRLYRITEKDLWYDEVLDILQVEKPLINTLQNDTPMHYLIVYVFRQFSSNILWLRMPSVLFGVASVVLLYFTVRKIFGKNTALFSTLMLAISPMIIEFSQQILHYSFFIFFTILTLYFYIDLLLEKKLRFSTVMLFIAATLMNLTTHVSAFMVVQFEFLFFVIYTLFHLKDSFRKFKSFFTVKRNLLFMLTLLIIAILFAFRLNTTNITRIINYSRFNSDAAIPLGYSLVAQLKTGVLTDFSPAFFVAMFSWFGNGGGYQLAIFFGLFAWGLILLLFRKTWMFVFTVIWVFGPFLLLHISRLSHWFEEKYFIFVVPVYLSTISYAVITTIDLIKWKLPKQIPATGMYILAAVIFLALSVGPIKIRTTYGYLVEGDQQFSWKMAIDYVNDHKGDKDIIMAIDDKFLGVYMGRENNRKTFMSEEDIIHYTSKQYMDAVYANYIYHYISIPDVSDMRIGPVITHSNMGIVGGFNIYRINFQKTTPVEFTGAYVDNFMKMKYLKDAAEWNNVIMSYNAEINIPYPQTEEENLIYLVPKSRQNAYISYKFNLKDHQGPLFLRINYIEKQPGELIVQAAEEDAAPVTLSRAISEKAGGIYKDKVFDLSGFDLSKPITLTFKFNYKAAFTNQLEVGIKSFGLFASSYTEPELTATEEGIYVYNAELEALKSTKWWTETYRNYGWVQTRYGILYRLAGDDNDALVYRFALPPGVSGGTLMTETFTKDNAINIDVSNSDGTYQPLARHVNELKEIEHTYNLPPELLTGQDYIYFRIQGDKPGQFAALRNFVVTLK